MLFIESCHIFLLPHYSMQVLERQRVPIKLSNGNRFNSRAREHSSRNCHRSQFTIDRWHRYLAECFRASLHGTRHERAFCIVKRQSSPSSRPTEWTPHDRSILRTNLPSQLALSANALDEAVCEPRLFPVTSVPRRDIWKTAVYSAGK